MAAATTYSNSVTNGETTNKWLIGTSAAVVYTFIPGSTMWYYELEGGREIDKLDILWIGFDIFKYQAPLSLPWSGDTTHYPGSVVVIGPDFAFQRFIWEGFYLAPIINPLIINYYKNNYIQTGFMLLFCLRAGYQFDFEIFKLPVYIQIGFEINYWPVNLNEPPDFAAVDNRYPDYEMNPALNIGFKF